MQLCNVTHISQSGNNQKENGHLKQGISATISPNKQNENHEQAQGTADKKPQENELPQQPNVQDPEELGQGNSLPCTPLRISLTLILLTICQSSPVHMG